MSEDELKKILADKSAPNLPAKIPGRSVGHIERVPEEEQAKRRRVLSRLLYSGRSDDEIAYILGQRPPKGFGMSPGAVSSLMEEVFREWGRSDDKREPHLRAAARRRLYDHIKQAKKNKSWSAVANLEKILMAIENTGDHPDKRSNLDERVAAALVQVVGDRHPEAVKAIFEKRTATLQIDGTKPPPETIDQPTSDGDAERKK